MQRLIRTIFFISVVLFTGNQAHAQLPTQHAIGARFGSATGINYRYSLSGDRAVEGIMSIQSNSTTSRFRIVGLYEYHKPLPFDNFSWFYGFGGSIGSFTYKSYTNENGQHIPKNTELSLSIDGVVGMEYNIPESPISLTLDLKPYLDFLQESTIRVFDPVGFSIRYNF